MSSINNMLKKKPIEEKPKQTNFKKALENQKPSTQVSTPDYTAPEKVMIDHSRSYQTTIRLEPGLKPRIEEFGKRISGMGASFSFNAFVNQAIKNALDDM